MIQESGRCFTRLLSIALVAVFGCAITARASSNFAVVQALVEFNNGTSLTDVVQTDPGFGDASSNVSASWDCGAPCSALGFSSSGAGHSGLGSLGSSVTVSVDTTPSQPSFVDAETIAYYTDTLTITGATGAGVLALSYAIDGSITFNGTGPHGGSASFFICDDAGCSDPALYYSLNGASSTNEHTSTPSFDSDASIVFYIPFTYGTPFNVNPRFTTEAQFLYGFGSDDSIPFSAIADFNSTATLSSALVLDGTTASPGTPVNGTSITSDDGFLYGPNGVSSAVPEPATWLLVCAPIGLLFLSKRLRSRSI